MEIIINKTTYTLKQMNAARRRFFVENVLVNYNYEAENFDAFIAEVKIELKNNHGIDKTTKQVTRDFFKQFAVKINLSIWTFLKDEDKKELKNFKNLDLESDQIKMFLEENCNKIKAYSDYIKGSEKGGEAEDIHTIFAFLSKVFGWTFDYMREMDELELIYAIEQAAILSKKDSIDLVNAQALAGAYASGSKKAKAQIDKMNSSIKHEIALKKMQKTNPTFAMENELSKEEMQKIMEKD